jgi:hypothetical protein
MTDYSLVDKLRGASANLTHWASQRLTSYDGVKQLSREISDALVDTAKAATVWEMWQNARHVIERQFPPVIRPNEVRYLTGVGSAAAASAYALLATRIAGHLDAVPEWADVGNLWTALGMAVAVGTTFAIYRGLEMRNDYTSVQPTE